MAEFISRYRRAGLAILLGAMLGGAALAQSPSGLAIRSVDETGRAPDKVAWEGKQIALKQGPGVTGGMVAKAEVKRDDSRHPAIYFSLTPQGRRTFADLTATSVGARIAILVDGKVVSAPVLVTPITGGAGMVTGAFTEGEARALADAINARAAKQ